MMTIEVQDLAAIKAQMTRIATEMSQLSKMHEVLKKELNLNLTPLAELMRTEITVKDALAAVKLEIRELKRKKKKDVNNADLEEEIKDLIKFAEAKNKEKIKLRKQIQLHVTKRSKAKEFKSINSDTPGCS